MAFFLTLVSVALCYYSPADVVPTLAPYHIQQYILVPALLSSVGVFLMRRGGLQAPQWVLMIGFWFAVVMSLIARYLLRASLSAFMDFGLVVCFYFLVSINAFSLTRIGIFCRVIALCMLSMAILGIVAYHTGYLEEKLVMRQMDIDGSLFSPRIRGYGILNDPNDFAQLLLVALAFLGVSWRTHNLIVNVIAVFVPAIILIYAIYLTGSRGAIFGLVVIAFVTISRRLGKLLSIFLAAMLFAVLIGAQFGGGREISLHESSTAGRLVAWGSGISDIKHYPVFGVGYGQFTVYNDQTAHNSFVLCFAESGLFGYFFWLAMIVTTVLGLEALARMPRKTAEDIVFARYVITIRTALYTFLATSWFLSRTYNPMLYILLALAGVLIYLRRSSFPAVSAPMIRWVPVTVVAQATSIVAVYITLRLRGL
ncbi:MAG: O-antigen ligase family protein [Acidobacteriia bacterium]|nr:O-antigen ligase family protein [Terriglobia bacterium]